MSISLPREQDVAKKTALHTGLGGGEDAAMAAVLPMEQNDDRKPPLRVLAVPQLRPLSLPPPPLLASWMARALMPWLHGPRLSSPPLTALHCCGDAQSLSPRGLPHPVRAPPTPRFSDA